MAEDWGWPLQAEPAVTVTAEQPPAAVPLATNFDGEAFAASVLIEPDAGNIVEPCTEPPEPLDAGQSEAQPDLDVRPPDAASPAAVLPTSPPEEAAAPAAAELALDAEERPLDPPRPVGPSVGAEEPKASVEVDAHDAHDENAISGDLLNAARGAAAEPAAEPFLDIPAHNEAQPMTEEALPESPPAPEEPTAVLDTPAGLSTPLPGGSAEPPDAPALEEPVGASMSLLTGPPEGTATDQQDAWNVPDAVVSVTVDANDGGGEQVGNQDAVAAPPARGEAAQPSDYQAANGIVHAGSPGAELGEPTAQRASAVDGDVHSSADVEQAGPSDGPACGEGSHIHTDDSGMRPAAAPSSPTEDQRTNTPGLPKLAMITLSCAPGCERNLLSGT